MLPSRHGLTDLIYPLSWAYGKAKEMMTPSLCIFWSRLDHTVNWYRMWTTHRYGILVSITFVVPLLLVFFNVSVHVGNIQVCKNSLCSKIFNLFQLQGDFVSKCIWLCCSVCIAIRMDIYLKTLLMHHLLWWFVSPFQSKLIVHECFIPQNCQEVTKHMAGSCEMMGRGRWGSFGKTGALLGVSIYKLVTI